VAYPVHLGPQWTLADNEANSVYPAQGRRQSAVESPSASHTRDIRPTYYTLQGALV
jgi:hypothetical protein